MTITEKTAYLKGLLDGLDMDKESPEGKLIAAIIDTLNEMASDLTDVADDVAALNDYVEEIDEDLSDVEDYLDGDDNDRCDGCECEDDCDDCECEGDCDNCECDCDGFYEVKCPHCGETVCFDETCNPRDLICPACQEHFDCLDAEDKKEEEN